jgi:hypothetical protein
METFMRVAKIDAGTLDREHANVWKEVGGNLNLFTYFISQLWHPGFFISHSRAPDTLNTRLINATRYAVLSNARAPLHEWGVTDERRVQLRRDMAEQAELCYSTHNTL